MASSTSALAAKVGVRNSPAAKANLILFSIVNPADRVQPSQGNVVLRGNSCRPIATELAEIAYAQDKFFSAMLRDDDPRDTGVRGLQRLQRRNTAVDTQRF